MKYNTTYFVCHEVNHLIITQKIDRTKIGDADCDAKKKKKANNYFVFLVQTFDSLIGSLVNNAKSESAKVDCFFLLRKVFF